MPLSMGILYNFKIENMQRVKLTSEYGEEELYFPSIKSAADFLKVSRTLLYYAVKEHQPKNGYYIEFLPEDRVPVKGGYRWASNPLRKTMLE